MSSPSAKGCCIGQASEAWINHAASWVAPNIPLRVGTPKAMSGSLDWDSMRIVLAIYRRGSMTGAADLLEVDRATVIRRLDALEIQLDSKLFDRRPDGCVLTRAGRDIIGLVEGVEQTMTALQHRVEGDDRRAEGNVRVAGPAFLLDHVVAPALGTLRSLHPSISVELHADIGELDLVRAETDIALRFVRPAHEAVVARKVGTIAAGLFASDMYLKKRGTPAADFSGHDMLMLEGPLGMLPFLGWPLAQLTAVRVPLSASDVSPLVAAATAGLGIACVPLVAAQQVSNLRLVPPGVVGGAEVFLATHRDLRSKGRVRSVFDFVVRLFAQRAAELSGADATPLGSGAKAEAR